MLEAGEREADHIEVAAFDARDVAASAALDGVAAGFIVRLFSGEIAGDFFGGEHVELDKGGFDEGEALSVGQADERHAGDDGVSAAGKFFEHVPGVVGRAGLAEDVAFEGDFRVGTDDDGGACGTFGDELGFGEGEALDEVVGGFAGIGRFVNVGGEHSEREAGVVEDFGAAGGGGGEDEFHGNFPWEEYYSERIAITCAGNNGRGKGAQYARMSEMDFIRPLAPIGVIFAVLCYTRRKKEVGGWLMFFYYQVFASIALFLLQGILRFREYLPSWWESEWDHIVFLSAVLPRLFAFVLVGGISALLLYHRDWLWVRNLKVALFAASLLCPCWLIWSIFLRPFSQTAFA